MSYCENNNNENSCRTTNEAAQEEDNDLGGRTHLMLALVI